MLSELVLVFNDPVVDLLPYKDKHVQTVRISSSHPHELYMKKCFNVLNQYNITAESLLIRDIEGVCSFLEPMLHYVLQNPKLIYLSICGVNFTPEERKTFVDGLIGNQTLRGLELGLYRAIDCTVQAPDYERLIWGTRIESFKILGMSHTDISMNAYRELFRRTFENGTQYLSDISTYIDDHFIPDAIDHLETYKINTINAFSINSTYPDDLKRLLYLLRDLGNNIERIMINNTHPASTTVEWLGDYFETSKGLKNVNMYCEKLSVEQIKGLIDSLIRSSSRSVLYSLRFNYGLLPPKERYDLLMYMISKTSVKDIGRCFDDMSTSMVDEIQKALDTPAEERFIELECNTKSAAKI